MTTKIWLTEADMTMLQRARILLTKAAVESWPNGLNTQTVQEVLDDVATSIDSAGDRYKHTLRDAFDNDIRLLWLMGACRDNSGAPQLGPDGRLACAWPQNADKKRSGDEIRQKDNKRARRQILDTHNTPTADQKSIEDDFDAIFETSSSPSPPSSVKSKPPNFKHTKKILKILKTRQYRRAPYDFLRNIVKTSNAVLLHPPEILKLLRGFDLAGYFKMDKMKIDQSILSAEAKTNGNRPLSIIGIQDYIILVKKTGDAIIRYQKYHNNKRIVFVVRMSTEGGGSGPGAWYCKGHVWTYLFFLKQSLSAVVNSSLLLLDDEATSEDIQKATGERDLRNILFVNLLDGIYSGTEAGNTLQWLDKIDPRINGLNGLIASPISAATEDSGIFHYLTCGDGTPRGDGINIYAAKCLEPGTYFVLPFKIPSQQSIGPYAAILNKMNPRFTPPYRRDTECRERR